MSFNMRRLGQVTVVEVVGQLIVGNRQELKRMIQAEVEAGTRRFVVDFAMTGYIDSSGLGILVSLSKEIREVGGHLRLASLSEDLRTLFELTKLDTLFDICGTLEEAVSE